MVWENNFFYLLFLNAVTGNIAFLLGKALMKIARRHGDAKFIYNLLHGIVLVFALPFSYVYVMIRHPREVSGDLLGYDGNLYTADVFHKIFLVWLIFASAITLFYGIRFIQYCKIRAMNIPCFDEKIRKAFDSIYPDSRLSGIPIYTNMSVNTPCIMGVIRPVLVLSEVPFTSEELIVMLAHEATHVMHRDTLWKFLGRIVMIACWWNPFLHWYMWDLENWSETYCDDTVCRRLLNGNKQKYATLLTSSVLKSSAYFANICSTVAPFGDRQTLLRRLKRLSKVNMGKRKAGVCALLTTIFVLGSGSTAIAAGELTSAAGKSIYMDTMEVESTISDEGVIDLNQVDNVTVFSMSPEEIAAEGYTIVEMSDNSGLELYATQKNFNWDVDAGKMCASKNFLKQKDSTIDICCYVAFPSSQTGAARIGVIEPDGTFVYVLGNCNSSTSMKYTCERLGYYKVAVMNIQKYQINANGYYVR